MKNEKLNTEQVNDLYNVSGISLFAYLDTIDCDLILRRYANQSGRWIANIEYGEIKEGSILIGKYGSGKNPEQAIEDFVQNIKGNVLVINAMTDKRVEYKVPDGLFFATHITNITKDELQ